MVEYRIATFNLENLDETVDYWPARIKVLRPMMQRIKADLLFLQEVNSKDALEELIQGTYYENFYVRYTTKNGNLYPKRNLFILSRYEILDKFQYHHDLVQKPMWRKATGFPEYVQSAALTWERPLLHCRIGLADGRVLHAVNLHLKSKNPTNIRGQKRGRYTWLSHEGWAEGYFVSAVKRIGQALEARILLKSLFEAEGTGVLIAVGGDLNATIGSVPFKAIVGSVEDTNNPELRDTVMIPCELNVPPEQRFSIIHHGRGEMLDHVVVSPSLYSYWMETDIYNELLQDESIAFGTDKKFPESDHAPVIARFNLPQEWLTSS